uniref:Kinesin motor domain-containing protein n=1 Tax=Knipowitschia caucasica TaxID=637954 RepID=A0AAV2JE61_KNICA
MPPVGMSHQAVKRRDLCAPSPFVHAPVEVCQIRSSLRDRCLDRDILRATVTLQQPVELNGEDELVFTVVEELSIGSILDKGRPTSIISFNSDCSLQALASGSRPVSIISSINDEFDAYTRSEANTAVATPLQEGAVEGAESRGSSVSSWLSEVSVSTEESKSSMAHYQKQRNPLPKPGREERVAASCILRVAGGWGPCLRRGVSGGRSRLHLIDLGSCEKVLSKSRDSGGGLCLSLNALGNVIMALANGAKHIPYRDSKLTMLLTESLGNINCRTTMIAHISDSPNNYAESLNTIQLASRIHRMRKKKSKYASSSSGGESSCEEGRIRKPPHLRPFHPRTVALDPDLPCLMSDPEYSSSSEQSCDTVIYVGPGGTAISDRELSDNEGPPAFVPIIPSLNRKRSGKDGPMDRDHFFKCNTFAELQERLDCIDGSEEPNAFVGEGKRTPASPKTDKSKESQGSLSPKTQIRSSLRDRCLDRDILRATVTLQQPVELNGEDELVFTVVEELSIGSILDKGRPTSIISFNSDCSLQALASGSRPVSIISSINDEFDAYTSRASSHSNSVPRPPKISGSTSSQRVVDGCEKSATKNPPSRMPQLRRGATTLGKSSKAHYQKASNIPKPGCTSPPPPPVRKSSLDHKAKSLLPQSALRSVYGETGRVAKNTNANLPPTGRTTAPRASAAASTKPGRGTIMGTKQAMRAANSRVSELSAGNMSGKHTRSSGDSDSGNDSGVNVNEDRAPLPMLPSPYSKITAPRRPQRYSSGHGSDNSSVLSGELPPAMGRTALFYHSGGSSGYESMIRDSEATGSASSAHDSMSESGMSSSCRTRSSKYPKKRTTGFQRRRLIPAPLPDTASLGKKVATAGQWVDLPPMSGALKEPFEIKVYEIDDVERLQRWRQEETVEQPFQDVDKGLMYFNSKLKLLERRQQQVRELKVKHETLLEELEDTKARLMMDPSKWKGEFDLDQSLDKESPEYVEALAQATEELEFCVNLCKSHVMMVTCFDISTSSPPVAQEGLREIQV